MGGGGLIWFLIIGVLIVVPFWKLLPRYGLPSWAALLTIFPLVALVFLWIMAFKDNGGGGRS
ncbi:NADH dehydrogenase [Marivita geojedonensis]|uniref:NADH dehydrogenase n=2 Tax=Marivita geojedonensis TaxID=1123756 RepID=A0A1X4NNS9_9RHOB|nr:NADH dehydrogenase [Marivita geojedonensis]